MWFIGDHFLQKVYTTLQETINTEIMMKKKKSDPNESMLDHRGKPIAESLHLYMNDWYNIKHFHDSKSEVAIGRMVNALIDGINTEHVLPKYLILIPDTDIINDLNIFEFGAHKGLAMSVNWLTKQVNLVIRRKKLQNLEKKCGSVVQAHPR